MNESGTITAPINIQPLDTRRNVFDFTPEKLSELIVEWGEPEYRARQVLHWLYKELASDFSQMSNLPLSLRKKLSENLRIGSASLAAQQISTDGWTRKALLRMRDGSTVEAVLMLYFDRATVCISSQVGCAMGCSFCATGQMGFTRNLTSGEIVEQVIWFNRWLREHPHQPKPVAVKATRYAGHRQEKGKPGQRWHDGHQQNSGHRPAGHHDPDAWHVPDLHDPPQTGEPITAVTNVVFMGMGEPLVNYNNLWAAIHLLNSPQGVGLGARRMTVSTVGIAPAIRRFARESVPVNLAVSLHAPNDALRGSMMPIDKHYPIAELMEACKEYTGLSHRRITFEYVLIHGTNDSLQTAAELRDLAKGMLCHVNLIPLNPVPGTGMQSTPREQVYAFQKVLEDAGIQTTVRIERGVDIAAACGQLKVQAEPNSRRRSLNPDLVQAHVAADLASIARLPE